VHARVRVDGAQPGLIGRFAPGTRAALSSIMSNTLLSLAILGTVLGSAGIASADRGGGRGGGHGPVTHGGRVAVTHGGGHLGVSHGGYIGRGGRGYIGRGYVRGYAGPVYGTTYVEPGYLDDGDYEDGYLEPAITVRPVVPRIVVRPGFHTVRRWR
jgi:hypothetical protein